MINLTAKQHYFSVYRLIVKASGRSYPFGMMDWDNIKNLLVSATSKQHPSKAALPSGGKILHYGWCLTVVVPHVAWHQTKPHRLLRAWLMTFPQSWWHRRHLCCRFLTCCCCRQEATINIQSLEIQFQLPFALRLRMTLRRRRHSVLCGGTAVIWFYR